MGQHWGSHFPDAARRMVTRPGVAAQLPLADPITISSAFQNVVIRARAANAAGNLLRFNMDLGTLSDVGEIVEDGNDVTLLFNDGDDAVQVFNTINATSTLVEAVGTVNPGEILVAGEDNFDRVGGPGAFIDLEGGRDPQIGRFATFFGHHFPLEGEDIDPPVVTPTSPPAAILAPRIEGLRVTYRWDSSVGKFDDGKEQRASNLEDPHETYDATVLLLGDEALELRNQLAEHAARGATFGLGLPYEETTLTDDATGGVVPVADTSVLDWAVVGQRVLILRGASDDIETATGVIQVVAAQSVTLDEAPGAVGVEGARIMPLVPVLLDRQQGFARYRTPDSADRWQIKAVAKRFGFERAAIPGELAITSGTLDGVTFRARTPGVQVNMGLLISGVAITFSVVYDEVGNFGIDVHVPAGTTLGELSAAITSNGLLWMLGDFDPDAVIVSGDEFGHIPFNPLTPFVGADFGGPGEMGLGATVAELAGRPLWDRGIDNESTITDSLESGAEIIEVGLGVPETASSTEVPDWGRSIVYTDELGEPFQWLKKFLATVKGSWKSFYLPTGRHDLRSVADVDGDTITIDAAIGNYNLWASRGYSWLEVVQGSQVSYVQIAADSSDGITFTLQVEGALVDDAPIDRISWCELVRLEKDVVEVKFANTTFTVTMNARVVQQ